MSRAIVIGLFRLPCGSQDSFDVLALSGPKRMPVPRTGYCWHRINRDSQRGGVRNQSQHLRLCQTTNDARCACFRRAMKRTEIWCRKNRVGRDPVKFVFGGAPLGLVSAPANGSRSSVTRSRQMRRGTAGTCPWEVPRQRTWSKRCTGPSLRSRGPTAVRWRPCCRPPYVIPIFVSCPSLALTMAFRHHRNNRA